MLDNSRLRNLLCSNLHVLAVACVLLTAQNTHAYLGIYTSFGNMSESWIGQGNVSMSTEGCIVSSTANNIFSIFFGAGNPRPYLLRINTPASFVMTNGSNQLPFILIANDLHGGGSQSLVPGQYSTSLTYNYHCFTLGNNISLNLEVNQVDLYSVPAGSYSTSINLNACRESNGGGPSGQCDSQSGISASVDIPPLVRISGMNDIDFGSYDGVSASVSRNESFCIYTNSGSFSVIPSSSTTAGSPGTFGLANGGNTIEYSVRISDSADASAGGLVTNNPAIPPQFTQPQTQPYSLNCNNSDNAAVFLEILGSELQSKPSGYYEGTLTLRVEPT